MKRMLLAVVTIAFISGCGSGNAKPASRSTLTTTIGARTIKATLDGNGSIAPKTDSAEISSGAGKIVVEKDRVVLDGKELAKLPESAAQVDVDYSNGTVTVKADGTQVYPAAATK